MPNPTSKLNLVINGATTQLDIHDANAVDLSSNQTVGGNKEFTGTTTVHDLVPSATDTYNFGTSTNKWKSFNGINPGALSLPSRNYISIDTTEFDVTATTIGTFTPTVDGWAILSITQKNKHFGIWVLWGSYRVTFHSVYHDGNYMIFALIPVIANLNFTIYCTADDIDSTRKIDWLKLFPCQGNV